MVGVVYTYEYSLTRSSFIDRFWLMIYRFILYILQFYILHRHRTVPPYTYVLYMLTVLYLLPTWYLWIGMNDAMYSYLYAYFVVDYLLFV